MTTPQLQTVLDACQRVRELAERATPGPWIQNDHSSPPNQLYIRMGDGCANVVVERKDIFAKVTDEDIANAALIVASKSFAEAAAIALPKLIEAMSRVVSNDDRTLDRDYLIHCTDFNACSEALTEALQAFQKP